MSFNQAKYLPLCVESVAAQGFADYEHIIVDPGSTDGSRDYLENLVDPHIKLLLKADSGPGEGLNNGLAVATGDIFYYLNADDELAPGGLEMLKKRHLDNPSADVVLGDGWLIDDAGRPVKFVRINRVGPVRAALGTLAIFQQSTSYRRTTLSRAPFNPANRFDWDAELLFDLAHEGRTFAYVSDSVGYFRLQDQSISVRPDIKKELRAANRSLFRREAGKLGWLRLFEVPARASKRLFNIARDLSSPPRFSGLSRLGT